MKDYKSFLEAAGEGFGQYVKPSKKEIRRQGKEALKQIQQDNVKEKEAEKKRGGLNYDGNIKPDGPGGVTPGPGGSEFRRRARERRRETVLDNMKDKRMAKVADTYKKARNALQVQKKAVGAAGGADSTERGVRYQ